MLYGACSLLLPYTYFWAYQRSYHLTHASPPDTHPAPAIPHLGLPARPPPLPAGLWACHPIRTPTPKRKALHKPPLVPGPIPMRKTARRLLACSTLSVVLGCQLSVRASVNLFSMAPDTFSIPSNLFPDPPLFSQYPPNLLSMPPNR